MKAKRLKELLAHVDDDCEIFIRNSVNPIGNIQELEQVEESFYSFFGDDISCLILNTSSSKVLEEDDEENTIDFIQTQD